MTYNPFTILARIEAKLDSFYLDTQAVLRLLRGLKQQGATMSIELDNLTAQVKANKDLTQSAVTLIHGLADQLQAAKDDPAKIQAIANDLKAQDATLAAALAENTPVQPIP